MWPWEHLAFGYVLYSLYCHLRYRRSPRAGAVIAVGLGTQLPDLIDKTLAWGFHVLPSGHSLAHSLLFALPLIAVVGVLAWRADASPVGVAFGVSYLSHLFGDVLYPLLSDGRAVVSFLIWPFGAVPTYDPERSFIEIVGYYFTRYVHDVMSGELTTYFVLQLAFMLAVFLLWLYDGAPVLAELGAAARRDRPAD